MPKKIDIFDSMKFGISRDKHSLTYGMGFGFGSGWLPGWAQKIIVSSFNFVTCRLLGHDVVTIPEEQPSCVNCGKTYHDPR